jgi:AcrR family transcriptional regulator
MEPKHDKILTSAFRLFTQHGFKKVTMSDIAEAAEMSRPTLYAAFPSKEAVYTALAAQMAERCDAVTAARLPRARSLETRLALLFEIWILEPFASVIDSPSGLDMLGNGATYAPGAHAIPYARLEHHLTEVLAQAITGSKRVLAAADLAHILTLAIKGLKATTATLSELRRMTDGLIAMAVATAGRG